MGLVFLCFERHTCGRHIRATHVDRCDKVLVGFYGATVLIGCIACSNTVEGADGRDGTGKLFLGSIGNPLGVDQSKEVMMVAQLVRRCPTIGSSSDSRQEQLGVRLSIPVSLSLSLSYTHTHTHVLSLFLAVHGTQPCVKN